MHWQGQYYDIKNELRTYLKKFEQKIVAEMSMEDVILLLKRHWNLCLKMSK